MAKSLKAQARVRWPHGKRANALLLDGCWKVRVRNVEGKYLATDTSGWVFSVDPTRAVVFDYVGDETRVQLTAIVRVSDLPLELVPLEPKDFLERCDRCHQLTGPSDICFDGARFLCRRCNNWPG
jgi:prepilin-type processing-associated H-X9-DG protein